MKERIINFIKSPWAFIPILIYLILLWPVFYLYSGSPPKDEITIYKGIYSSIFPTKMTMDAMVEDGMNIVSISVSYPVGSNGNIYTIPFIEEIKIAQIQAAHRKGLNVFLLVEPLSNRGPFIPENVTNNPELLESFLKQYNLLVLKWAEIAEKYGVELFTPMNEFEISLGSIEKASDWGQEMLPKIKDRYHGKIVWKGALVGYMPEYVKFYGPVEEFNINLTGYDYIGLTILVPHEIDFDSLRNSTRRLIETVRDFAERAGIKGVMITEFGYHREKSEKYPSEEDCAMGYQIILEEGKDKVVGFFVIDAPEFLGGPTLRGSLREQTIKEWFRGKLL